MTGGFLAGKVDAPLLPAATIDDVPATPAETRDAARRLMFDEEMSFSEQQAFAPLMEQRKRKAIELGMDPEQAEFGANLTQQELADARRNADNDQLLQLDPETLPAGARVPGRVFEQQRAAQYVRALDALSAANPGALQTDEEIIATVSEIARAEREANQRVLARGRTIDSFVGSFQAGLSEPYLLATLPFGAGAGVGRSLLGGAARTFAIEAGIAGATEIPLQAEILAFKRRIDSPYTMTDAASSVVLSALTAGGLASSADLAVRGLPQLIGDYRAAREAGTIPENAEADNAVRILEEAQRRDETRPQTLTQAQHSDAIDEAIAQFSGGDIAEVGRFVPDEDLGEIAPQFQGVEAPLRDELVSYVDEEPPVVEMSAQFQRARNLVADEDFDIPIEIESDFEGGESTFVTKSARELLDEVETQRSGLDALRACFAGGGA
ncbi:MAG: hypothetical protein AAFV47_09215 [Pseudomonadota bacterium]